MFERVEIGKKIGENMKGDEELEMLLDEIPHATSHNLHHHLHQHEENHVYLGDDRGSFVSQTIHGMYGMYDDDPSTHSKYTCASSPVSGFSLQSDGSSSSLFSAGHSFSDNGSPTPSPLEEHKSNLISNYPNKLWLDSKIHESPVRKKANQSLVDELRLCGSLGKMYIGNEQENSCNFIDASVDLNGYLLRDCSLGGSKSINVHKHSDYDTIRRGFIECGGVQSPFTKHGMGSEVEISSALSGMQQEYKIANVLGLPLSPGRPDIVLSQLNRFNSPNTLRQKREIKNYYTKGSLELDPTASISGHPVADSTLKSQNVMNLVEEKGDLKVPNSSHLIHPMPYLSVENLLHYGLPLSNARTRTPSNIIIPQEGLDAITSEQSFIIQGEGLNYVVSKGYDCSRGHHSKGVIRGTGLGKHLERSQLANWHHVVGTNEKAQTPRMCYPVPILSKCNSLADAQGYIYLIAKDQHGCRFLQRVFDEGTPQDVRVIFNEIIDHVVELMMNPFGNYLMQKLLDVCNEEQRLQILLMVTVEPGQLVRISLNTHGTRVVQKLIETLKTRQQKSLVISALEPGFLALIKDLNGNHVVQRCLQCLGNEDNKFIFVAAAKYCVDIATHQHGCCVLQRCISHSIGDHRDNLVAEISANGLLLSQDAYGNYVVQFILELKIPSATSNLISQFEGNYVHLSTQKFSSHVIEKCLMVFNNENQSRVIAELLSTSHFEQLLQDPHANYVVQTALRFSEGHWHNRLVEAIESHKAISRNSPYSKRIFSQKLLKK
ncbi:Pumilio 7 like [Quillaja saponaria]|uniref:Pumilio 7 like n=1 Tax=Quillaja saponaria TaxID=32244 RepID=A0AAD7PTZ7_QUISA|nr:Pumilio 7 like [Quillaja saponaria]